jgi:hypothetical protein
LVADAVAGLGELGGRRRRRHVEHELTGRRRTSDAKVRTSLATHAKGFKVKDFPHPPRLLGLPFSLVRRSVTMGGLTSTICFIGIGSLS